MIAHLVVSAAANVVVVLDFTRHCALDYSQGSTTFAIKAMAAGTVIFVGWDNWSGNSVVVSHFSDTWRTLYMHVRDGPLNDCKKAREVTLPWLAADSKEKTDYQEYLTTSGCTSTYDKIDETYWGKNADKIPVTQGQTVTRGQTVAWAGNTGALVLT